MRVLVRKPITPRRMALTSALLALLVALGGPAPARAMAGPEPLVLSADRATYWDEGRNRYVLLEGRASFLQGTEGLRADRLVARIESPAAEVDPAYKVEAVALGHARWTSETGAGAQELRTSRVVPGEVRIKAAPSGRVLRLDSRPSGIRWLTPVLARLQPPVPDMAPAQPAAEALADLPQATAAPADTQVARTQFGGDSFGAPAGDDSGGNMLLDPLEPPGNEPGALPEDDMDAPGAEGIELAPPTELPSTPRGATGGPTLGPGPVLPASRRTVSIFPKDSGGLMTSDVKIEPDGTTRVFLRGGVNVVSEAAGQGTIDITSDNVVIFTSFPANKTPSSGSLAKLDMDENQPFEIYLEGNVILRQDKRTLAGSGDQKVVEAERLYFDLRNEWFIAENGRLNVLDPRFVTPIKVYGERIQQYRPLVGRTAKGLMYGPTEIHADRTMLTGSRFPKPGYRFKSRSIDMLQLDEAALGPDGKPLADPDNPIQPTDSIWQIDARRNVFQIGPVPVFFWPRLVTESDDLDPPIRQIQFRTNNYFGQQILTDWTMFKLLGIRRPPAIDNWNLDIDYLSARGTALGTEIGWSGRDVIDNIVDPFNRDRSRQLRDSPYFGYFDIWGLQENRGVDTLGTGPAVITNGPISAGKQGFQRDASPSFEDFRGRVELRHMQSLLSNATFDEDFRIQAETGYTTDRQFLEQYYKNLFDAGLDQSTLVYGIYQKENRAITGMGSLNLMDFNTASQYFPKVDYTRLGDSVLGNLFTWYQNWGVSYTNVHTDIMVNDPNLFAFQPYDPVSATSGAFQSGRLWTAHELDLPINLRVLRITPYVQGQLTGWDSQYQTDLPSANLASALPVQSFIRGADGAMLGRAWGGVGARANIMAWKNYAEVESELLNVHGLSHKVNFDLDYRTTYSNVNLSRIGIQDELDDNTYEYVRRYFALVNYSPGILPAQYDPRLLTLRRTISPITGTTDVQDDMQTLRAGIHQRLQTKRGPEGRRRIVDYMILDLDTTYFPYASRDNFGKPFGQNMYNWEWYVGDRTSLISTGWFEFFDIVGNEITHSNPVNADNPFGFSAITSGISINRPPRGNVFFGYTVINTGPIATSALNVTYSYWMSPKWFTSFSTSYDFGNAILLGSTFGITRVGADFLTSVGLTVDPQRDSYMFGVELTPRLSPNIRFGSGGGISRFDSRYAPTQ